MLLVGNASAQTCNSTTNVGAIVYNSTNKALEWCNGEEWRNLIAGRYFGTATASTVGRTVSYTISGYASTIAVSDGANYNPLQIAAYASALVDPTDLTDCSVSEVNKIYLSACTTSCVVGNTGCGGEFAACDQGGGLYHLIAEASDLYGGTTGIFGANGTFYGFTSASNGVSNTQNFSSLPNNISVNTACSYVYNSGGFGDWYLPAENELSTLYTNRTAIGGFSTGKYWSSTEVDANNMRVVNFTGGAASSDSKTSSYRFRCVRRAYIAGVPMNCTPTLRYNGSSYVLTHKLVTLDNGVAGSCPNTTAMSGGQATYEPMPPNVTRALYTAPNACNDVGQFCANYHSDRTCSNGFVSPNVTYYGDCTEEYCCLC